MRLLTDAELRPPSAGIERDPGVPGSVATGLVEHPVFGADFRFYLALTYGAGTAAALGLSPAGVLLNRWYRFERFRLLYDELERYCAGNGQMAFDLLVEASEHAGADALAEAHERVEREVAALLVACSGSSAPPEQAEPNAVAYRGLGSAP